MRHPHDIVPRDDKDEFLIAIYDVLCAIHATLRGGVDGPVRAEEASAAEVVPEPTPAAAPPKPPAKKRATQAKKSPKRK